MIRPRNIIKELKLREISAVDDPAQVHARALIMKRKTEMVDCKNCQGKGCEMCGQPGKPAVKSGKLAASEGGDQTVSKEIDMSDEAKKVADLEKQVADLTKRAAEAELQVAELTKSIAKKDEEIADVKKAKEAAEKDEVIKVGETEVKKSAVGESIFAVVKAQQEDIRKEREAREEVELTKRAETEFPSLPGEPIAKAKVLKAVARMSEEDRKALETMLKAGEAAMKTNFGASGHDGPGLGSVGDSPSAKMEKMAEEYAAKNNVTVSKAHDDLRSNREYRELYKSAYGSKAVKK